MPSPGIEIRRIGMFVLGLRCTMKMKYEFVRREKYIASGTFDAFGSRAVVTGRDETSIATPATLVLHIESKVVRQLQRSGVFEKRLDEAFSFPLRDHAASPGGDGHRTGSTKNFQLYWSTLDACYAKRYSPVVDLIVAKVFQ